MPRNLRFGILAVIVIILSSWTGKSLINEYFFAEAAPVQPINFSHKKHSGENKISCKFCHIYADRSKSSGVPSVKRCMGCHSSIRKDSPEIKKLTWYYQNKVPIKWVKIHDLPDYVYFPHKRHVKNDKVKCQECHGDIASMKRVRKVSYLVMGWCLACHTKRNGPTTDCWECHI